VERDKCGGEGGGQASGDGGGVVESTVERESEEGETCCRKTGEDAVFFQSLGSIFSSLRPRNAALFIGNGRGIFYL
jgi:hypothetical protein